MNRFQSMTTLTPPPLPSTSPLSPLPLHLPPSTSPPPTSIPGEDGEELLYGTQNGKMGLVKLQANEPSYRWDMLNERRYGGITTIATSDLTGDGVCDIMVGRDDGVVEVYGFEDSDEPRLKFTHVSGPSLPTVHASMYTLCKDVPSYSCYMYHR